MKALAILLFALVLLLAGSPLFGKCGAIPVKVQGQLDGNVREGDVLILQFTFSPKRVETSAPQPAQPGAFTIIGGYSTFKRRGLFSADICGAAPRQTQLLLRDSSGKTLDAVNLTSPDPIGEVVEITYGKKQAIVIHRPAATFSSNRPR